MAERARTAWWVFAVCCLLGGCGIEPDRVFERNSPEVDEAIEALDAGEAGVAATLLEEYLKTGQCNAGNIGVSERVKERKSASFDLGLTLFHFAEQYGARFGKEAGQVPDGGPTPEQQQIMKQRSEQVSCALSLLRAIGESPHVPVDLAARAKYLEGNLEFLRMSYREAVDAYDQSLRLVPGIEPDAGGDEIGRDAAWNRAIALRRIRDQNERDAGKDAPDDRDGASDASPDTDSGSPDAGPDGPSEGGPDAPPDAPSDGSGDGASDGGGGGDAGGDGGPDGSSPDDENSKPDAGAPDSGQQPPPEPVSQDDRILDMLEEAPTVQFENARRRAGRRRVGGMVDK